MNSKATYSGASLAAGTQCGQVSDKDVHADPSRVGAGRGTITDRLKTLTTGKPLPENRPKCHRTKSGRRPDNLCGMKQFSGAVLPCHTLRVYLKAN